MRIHSDVNFNNSIESEHCKHYNEMEWLCNKATKWCFNKNSIKVHVQTLAAKNLCQWKQTKIKQNVVICIYDSLFVVTFDWVHVVCLICQDSFSILTQIHSGHDPQWIYTHQHHHQCFSLPHYYCWHLWLTSFSVHSAEFFCLESKWMQKKVATLIFIEIHPIEKGLTTPIFS